jgi:hypothetical protein
MLIDFTDDEIKIMIALLLSDEEVTILANKNWHNLHQKLLKNTKEDFKLDIHDKDVKHLLQGLLKRAKFKEEQNNEGKGT